MPNDQTQPERYHVAQLLQSVRYGTMRLDEAEEFINQKIDDAYRRGYAVASQGRELGKYDGIPLTDKS